MPRYFSSPKRLALTGLGVVAVLAIAGVGVFAAFGGFDPVSRQRVGGAGTQVVEVRLVDQRLGFDVQPDLVEVEAGTHVVLDVRNEAGARHDLKVDGVDQTRLLEPGENQRLDLGRVDHHHDAWCTVGSHEIGGMTLDVRVIE